MNTPPVTPREGNRRLKSRTRDSCHQVLTPAKTDDFSRPSSIRLPKDVIRSPITTFKQPVIRFDHAHSSPPLIKKRKSTTISPRLAVGHARDGSLSERHEEGFRTPPHREVSKNLIYAPRKPRCPTSNNTECDLFEPVRTLDFGQEKVTCCDPIEMIDGVDWDSVAAYQQHSSKDVSILRQFVSAVALSGIDTHGECKSSDLKALLSISFSVSEYDRCIKLLEEFSDMILWTDYGTRIRFLNSYSPREILRRVQKSTT